MSSDSLAAATVSYVYAIGRSGTPLDGAGPGLVGLGGEPVRTVSTQGLVALVSRVPADAFSSEGMKAQMENIERLEKLVRTHHAVIEAAYASTTVLPMRLATVYLDDARVGAMLRERGRDFGELLDRLDGHVELGVKVYADPREQEPTQGQDTHSDASPISPGRAYLRRRQTQRRSHQEAFRAAGAVAAQVPDRVPGLALDRVVHRPQQGELATVEGENIANEAYLVPVDRVADFRTAVGALADDVPGVRIELTGPWAPYSFATPQGAAPAAALDGGAG